MSANPLPPINGEELLARFITVERWLRADKSIRQDAFIPPKDMQLSTTRRIGLSEAELWSIGKNIAAQVARRPQAPLFGRADIAVAEVALKGLDTEAAPLADNPNHAHLIGWPEEKQKQKIIAQQLAASALFIEE